MNATISEVQITPVKPKDGLVGFASFVYDGSFYLGSIGIYTRPQGGYRLTYPTRNGSSGSFNIFHPINKEIAQEVEKEVINRFEEVTKAYVGHNSINTK
jgi:DNA-binding cell septation regulator SpoVG